MSSARGSGWAWTVRLLSCSVRMQMEWRVGRRTLLPLSGLRPSGVAGPDGLSLLVHTADEDPLNVQSAASSGLSGALVLRLFSIASRKDGPAASSQEPAPRVSSPPDDRDASQVLSDFLAARTSDKSRRAKVDLWCGPILRPLEAVAAIADRDSSTCRAASGRRTSTLRSRRRHPRIRSNLCARRSSRSSQPR